MHTGSYGLMPEDGPPRPAGPGRHQGRPEAWPVWPGSVPPLADGFTLRPDSVPGLEAALAPGAAVALVPGRPSLQAPARDWRESTGKTQLARYYAESLWRSPGLDVLAWVAASSRASVLSGYVQAATVLGASTAGDAEAVATRFVGWLGQTRRPWLVVLDDVRDAADLRGLWPTGPAGLLLVTTGDPATVSGEFRPLTVPVPAFSTREAMTYLSGRLSADPHQRSGAIDLVGDLAGEPIALAQASAVMASSGMTCRDYRQHFGRRRARLAEAGRAEPPAGAVTWTFSAEYAEHLSAGVSIRSLVALAALLDGHGIPGAVFTTRACVEYLTSDGGAQPPDPQRAWSAILNLRRAGLLTVDPPAGTPPTVRISPAIQAAIRTAIPAEVLDRAVTAAADALVEVWPRDDDPRSWRAAELRSCAASLRETGTGSLWADGRCHPLLLMAGQSADGARLTGPAVAYWRELAADAERALGSGHLETLAVLGHLGQALLTAGQAAEAASCLQRVLDGRASALGPDHPGTIAAKVSLGHALVAAGRPGDALGVLEEAIAGSEIIRGADHAETLTAREEYAAACRAAGRTAEAIRAYRQALADRARIQGPRHPDTMTASAGLAGAYLAAGQTKDALAQYKRVLADREGVLSADHPDTLLARSSLAAAYFAAGRMGSVLQLYEAACAGYARTLGPDHPTTLTCQAELARAYYVTGRLGDATNLLTEAIARSKRALPPDDPLTQAMQESLANITG
ncbi:MAG: tetratricopeptide repeat protein [Actinobacteria bacterium]|nr:tetratricopeptide repeat protein [Actinomycetota bacterium]